MSQVLNKHDGADNPAISSVKLIYVMINIIQNQTFTNFCFYIMAAKMYYYYYCS